MSEQLKDILTHLNPDIDQQTLLRYLEGQLSAGKQHELEKQLLETEFEQEALEGLQQFGNTKDVAQLVAQLNNDLRKRTGKRRLRNDKLKFRIDHSIWIAIVLILLLVTIAFYIIHLSSQGKP